MLDYKAKCVVEMHNFRAEWKSCVRLNGIASRRFECNFPNRTKELPKFAGNNKLHFIT